MPAVFHEDEKYRVAEPLEDPRSIDLALAVLGANEAWVVFLDSSSGHSFEVFVKEITTENLGVSAVIIVTVYVCMSGENLLLTSGGTTSGSR